MSFWFITRINFGGDKWTFDSLFISILCSVQTKVCLFRNNYRIARKPGRFKVNIPGSRTTKCLKPIEMQKPSFIFQRTIQKSLRSVKRTVPENIVQHLIGRWQYLSQEHRSVVSTMNTSTHKWRHLFRDTLLGSSSSPIVYRAVIVTRGWSDSQ